MLSGQYYNVQWKGRKHCMNVIRTVVDTPGIVGDTARLTD